MPLSPEAGAPRSPRPWNLLSAALVTAYFVAMSVANFDFGRGDNGDFRRYIRDWIVKPRGFATMWPAAEQATQCRFFDCWLRDWELRPPGTTPEPAFRDAGTARLLWRAGLALNRAFVSRQIADLRIVGLPARLATLAVLLMLLRSIQRSVETPTGPPWRASWLALLVVAPAVVAAADPRVTTYFHSFYRESALFPFALTAACGLAAFRADSTPAAFARSALLFTAGAALVAANAPGHWFIAGLAVAALYVATRRLGGAPTHGVATWSLATILMLVLAAVGVFSERRTEPAVRSNAAFNSLFAALKVSADPGAHLASLGLPASLVGSVGLPIFALTQEQGRIAADNAAHIRHSGTLRVLAREPAILPHLLGRAAAQINDARGALHFATDVTGKRAPRWPWWTAAKGRLPGGVWLGLLGLLPLSGLAALRRSDRRGFAAALLLSFASLAALAEVVVSVLGDGFSDIDRHLVGASFLIDVALTAALWLVVMTASGIGRPPEKASSAARP